MVNIPDLVSRSLVLGLLLIGSGLRIPLALALPEDRHAPIQVRAEQMQWHQERQQAIYTGSVEVIQGELRLEATYLRLYRGPQGDLAQAIAEGQAPLASMRDLPKQNQHEVRAWAERIDYHPAEDLIILTGQAYLTRGEDSFRAHRLTYHLTTQDLHAERANENAHPVEIILTPQRREP